MARRPVNTAQMDLLDWTPPEPVTRFDEDQVRAASIAGKVCRGVSVSLKEAAEQGLSREDIARAMSDFLGAEVSKNMLDAYASQAREDHIINVVRFIALIHATKDRRLLEMIAEMFGWAVIDRKYLRLIKLGALQDRRDDMTREIEAERRQAKAEGLL